MRESFWFFVVFLLISCRTSTGGEGKKSDGVVRKVVEAEVVFPKTLERRIKVMGTVKGGNEVLVFPDMGGKLVEINVYEGQYVRKGQVLALIDRSAPGVEVKPLPVIAPASGYVYLLVRDLGASVNRSTPIMGIVDRSNPKVVFGVPERFAPAISRKTEVFVEGKRVRVLSVSPVLDPTTKTLSVRASAPDGYIPGQGVEVEVVVEKKENALVVPISAVVGKQNVGVFVIRGGRAEFTPVKLGVRAGEEVETVEGLREGDTVVVFGASTLNDGDEVLIRRLTTSAPSKR